MRCRRCGLRRLNPRPSDESIGGYYGSDYGAFVGRTRSQRKQRAWELLRDAYSRPVRPQRPAIVSALAPLAKWAFDINVRLDRRAGLRVLDVGCGFGDLLIYLRSRGCEVEGVDLDARAAVTAARSGIPVRTGHLRDCSLQDASYDVIVMSHSLEHVADPAGDLAHCFRRLRPGGLLHLAVPNGASAGLAVDGAGWIHLSLPLHFWFFDTDSLGAMVSRTGFEIIDVATTSRWHNLGVWKQQVLAGQVIGATARLGRLAAFALSHRDAGDVLRMVAQRPSG